MHITITRHVAPILVASIHGLTDLQRPLPALWPYAVVPCVPREAAFPLFFVASTRHFARDVGIRCSVALHVLWVLLFAANMEGVAWDLFAMFYCGVHALLHTVRTRSVVVRRLLFLGALLAPASPSSIVVSPAMQLLVVAHVVCEEVGREGR